MLLSFFFFQYLCKTLLKTHAHKSNRAQNDHSLNDATLNIVTHELLSAACWVDDKKKKVLCQWPMPLCTPVPVMISIHKHAVRYPPPGSCLCAYEITIMHLPVPRINISPLLKFASMRHILVPYDLSIPSGITCNLFSFYIHCSTLMGI